MANMLLFVILAHLRVLMLFSCRYDVGKDGFIDLFELKLMMEKLEAPQTHLGLKAMIKEVDEDLDEKISFREVFSNYVMMRLIIIVISFYSPSCLPPVYHIWWRLHTVPLVAELMNEKQGSCEYQFL